MDILKQIQDEQIKEVTDFVAGDTVQVHYLIKEGDRERIQIFEGTVIKKQGGSSVGSTFTVRRLSSGVGVERTFALNSPKIDNLVVTRRGKAKRAKLNYLRDRIGKASKVKERQY